MGELGPVFAAVRGLEDAAPRPARDQLPRFAVRLPEGGVQHGGVRRVEHEIRDSRRVVAEQHLAPRLAAVGRLVNAAVRVGPKAWPWAPTQTVSGFVGCTRTREIWWVSSSPTCVHVFPPSVVFHTPSPWETLPRIGYSPVPT